MESKGDIADNISKLREGGEEEEITQKGSEEEDEVDVEEESDSNSSSNLE